MIFGGDPFCDEAKGGCAVVEYGTGADGAGVDLIRLTGTGSITVYRFFPPLRRVRFMQNIVGSGESEAANAMQPNPPRLPAGIAQTGIAAADDGRTVYVQATSDAHFERDPKTGLLTFSDVRLFVSEDERSDFLKTMRGQWIAGHAARQQRCS